MNVGFVLTLLFWAVVSLLINRTFGLVLMGLIVIYMTPEFYNLSIPIVSIGVILHTVYPYVKKRLYI